MIVVSADEVRAALPWGEAIELMKDTMIRVARGGAILPLRHLVNVGGENSLGIMPGGMGAGDTYGVKLLSLFPGNPAKGLSSHIGVMVLFDPETGRATAALDADALTAIRTAAASAAATRTLARDGAAVMAVIGAGEQAEAHIHAIAQVRNLREIRICGRRKEAAQALAAKMEKTYPDIAFLTGTDVGTATSGAEIVCTVTSSKTPVLGAAEIDAGTHVNAVGASVPSVQEIRADLAAAARLFVDYTPSALAQAREIIDAIAEGQFGESHILGEIGAVFDGRVPGRRRDDEITLYRSLGVAAQDIASAEHVRRKLTS